jgi:hypothetical protein
MKEEDRLPLAGGNSGIVVRQGETVRRPAGPWTPMVQRFMSALRHCGLTFVPEPLGLDDNGREIVAYISGSVPIYPMPDWVWSDNLLVDVGTRLRELHDATANMSLPMTGWRRDPISPAEVICHGDIAPTTLFALMGGFLPLSTGTTPSRLRADGTLGMRLIDGLVLPRRIIQMDTNTISLSNEEGWNFSARRMVASHLSTP